MRASAVLSAHLLAILVAGCGTVENEACLDVAEDAECPTVEAAEEELAGTELCTNPVLKLVRLTGFLERRPGWPSYYGTDTGIDDPDYDLCCYEGDFREKSGESCVVGRPLLDGEALIAAPPVASAAWSSDLRPRLADLDPEARAALAAHWAHVAAIEHASIASFARFSLDLTLFAAPPELLADTHRAALDEVGHARDAYALASAYAGRPVGPGALPLRQVELSASLADFAAATFRDGCVGEAIAAALAATALAQGTDPAVRVALARVVREEAAHAALAWRAVEWARRVGGIRVEARLTAAIHAGPPAWRGAPAGIPAHGLLDDAAVQAVIASTWAEVIRPLSAEILA